MKTLLTTHPATGHLYPMLPIAEAIKAAGHEVRFATAPRFVPKIRALGFECDVAGMDWLESETASTFPEIGELDFPEVNEFFMRSLFTGRLARPMIRDLRELIERHEPDIVVRETWEFAGALAAEAAGIPHAVVSAGLNFEIWKHMVADTVADLRRENGLTPDPELRSLCDTLVLDHAPSSFQFPDLPMPSGRVPVGRTFFDGGTEETGMPEVPRDAPLVYVTAGTVFNRLPGFFSTILEGLATEEVQVLVTTGVPLEPADLGLKRLPENVTLASYVPQSRVLQEAAVMISHGGFNTVLGALNFGVPLLMVPIAADHGQNALRVQDTGCGLCIPFHRRVSEFPMCQPLENAPAFCAGEIRDGVRRLISDRSFAMNSRKMQLEALGMPGPARAVAALEARVRPSSGVSNRGPNSETGAESVSM